MIYQYYLKYRKHGITNRLLYLSAKKDCSRKKPYSRTDLIHQIFHLDSIYSSVLYS